MENYNYRMKELRQNKQMSQREIAEELKITMQQYQLYESGKRELPIKHLITLCRFYGVTSDYILGLSEENV